ncbi:MAG: HAMP domain-containing protein [Comamonadaceae bacterium]|nr:MAG: HAMP domain-containing protein [Comamonadaceae bacterium]
MARLWPGSLFGRITLILFCGLAAAHVLSFWLVFMERGMAARTMMVSYLARDLASSVAILERLPAAERASWLPRLARANYRFQLEPQPADTGPSLSALADPVVQAVGAALEPPREVRALQPQQPGLAMQLRLQLADGTPLAVDLLEPKFEASPWVLAVLAVQLALLGLLTWLAVRLATRPLQALADAADALGPAHGGARLPEHGPREVARAAAAFNAMQQRIQAHLAERMHILAAVSHDLQTPITRLRLRADLLDDEVLRGKLLADLGEMQGLVEEGIAYARAAHAVREPLRQVDLAALLDSLACDYTDAGQPVVLHAPGALALATRPQALRRLLVNLVDNALKFAGAVEIDVERMQQGLAIRVLDRGPGIPQEALQLVLQPFTRLETSRNRDTGGTGLGLAIAQQLAQALDGRLLLGPREGGGLEARLEIPLQRANG